VLTPLSRKKCIFRSALKPMDAAYIAGLIDGEGTITLSRKHRNDNRQLALSISNNEKRLLEFVLEKVGAGHISSKRVYSEKHFPNAAYKITNRQALDLLEQITPFLQSYKQERAKLVLNDYVRLSPRNGKYTPQQNDERETFIKNFFDIQPV